MIDSMYLALIIFISTCTYAFGFPVSHSAGKVPHTRLLLAYDEDHHHHHHHESSSNKSGGNARVAIGEEALHSAMMARRVRKLRNNRGLVTEKDIKDDEKPKIHARKSLLTEERRDAQKTRKERKAWTNVDKIDSRKKIPCRDTSVSMVKTKKTKTTKLRRSNGIDLPYQCTIQALKVYFSDHGDLVLPRRYIVPEDDAYPREWHGVDLAATVYDMKWWQQHVKQKPERVAELSKMGFIWERLQPQWNLVLEALIYYSTIYGDVMVPKKFVVPFGDSLWPKATWGIPLGNCVYRIRHRDDFLRGASAESRRDQLDGLGFVWDVQEHRFQIFYNALEHFARINGATDDESPHVNTALRVPAIFVIPSTETWPSDLWGYPLGAKCTAVRQKQLYVKDNPQRQEMLEKLRFQWNGNASLGWLRVMHAAAIYSKLHDRHLDVPYNFRVPAPPLDSDPQIRVDTCTAADQDEVWPWPDYLWGLPLGQRLKDVRQKGAYLKGKTGAARRRQLDALGFNWSPKRGRPKKEKVS